MFNTCINKRNQNLISSVTKAFKLEKLLDLYKSVFFTANKFKSVD